MGAVNSINQPLGLNLSLLIMMFLVIIVIGPILQVMGQILEEVGILISKNRNQPMIHMAHMRSYGVRLL